jgi:hypothetical protein
MTTNERMYLFHIICHFKTLRLFVVVVVVRGRLLRFLVLFLCLLCGGSFGIVIVVVRFVFVFLLRLTCPKMSKTLRFNSRIGANLLRRFVLVVALLL